ncbi:MAG: hypothetical protein LBH61_00960 [Dysgonamonadaceae bacterium]|jgi:uncharacterized membrane-anchored protein YhcB (DUF1043 family)|nr:hypothetical protein [Dysgonamonadaceae bacterium]
MKNSGLWIGLGIGLLVGVALGAYFASDEEDRAEFKDAINSKVNNAKKTIGKIVEDGLEELDKATEKAGKVAKETFSKINVKRSE